jgi:NTE family protein
LLDGERIKEFLLALLGERDIEDLKIPFASIATDIWLGEEIILDSGSLVTAIRASIAVPFLFKPLEFEGRHLVDGGVVNPLPVSIAREMGADYVIAVGATPSPARHIRHMNTGKPIIRNKMLASASSSTFLKRFLQYFDEDGMLKKALNSRKTKPLKKPGMRRQMVQMGVTMENMILSLRLKENPPDVLVSPKVDEFQFFDFARSREIIYAGEQAALKQLDKINHIGKQL